jgi:YegS/Rv2252/BmrU family lipid kinase
MESQLPVIVNPRSGQDGTDLDAIAAVFRKHGLDAEFVVLQQGQAIAPAVDELLARGATRIVAGGGDGTINAVAARLVGRNVALGVLPLGTLNHFARDLGIPFDPDAAVRIIREDHAVTVDVGAMDGDIFLNNASIGLYPRIVSGREHARRHLGHGKWPALARATWDALQDPESFSAVVRVDGQELQRRTPFIFVGNNPYVLEGFGIGRRTTLDGGVLSLYVLRPKSAFGLLWLGIRALFGMGSHSGDFDAFESTDFRIQARRERIEVAADGEVAERETPMRFRILPRALRVLAPRPDAAGGG